MYIRKYLFWITILSVQIALAGDKYESFVISTSVSGELNTGGGLYSQTSGPFKSERIYDVSIEYSSNKKTPEYFGASFSYQFSKYENKDFSVKNEMQSFLVKMKYMPLIESNAYFAALVYPNLGYDEYTISSSNAIQSNLKGFGVGIGYDFVFNKKYLIRAEYNTVTFSHDKFNSEINNLNLGVGYKW